MTGNFARWAGWMALPLALSAAPLGAGTPLRVDITEGVRALMQIAVATSPNGAADGPGASNANLAGIVAADLGTTGRYRIVTGADWFDGTGNPALSRYQAKGIEALVVARLLPGAGAEVRYDCALYDVFEGRARVHQQIAVRGAEWRRAAHKCADAVFEATTGGPGHFDTRLVYVAHEGAGSGATRRLAIMDFDGENRAFLSDGKAFLAMPRFASSGRSIVVSVIENGTPRLRVLDTGSARFRDIPLPAGQPLAARVSPDGRSVVFSMAIDGESDLYRYDLAGGALVRLTNTPGHDTSASFSPDGKWIAFESTRSGTQQIYVMAADGSGQKRVSFGAFAYGSPVWSPRDDLIAYTRTSSSGMQVGIMRSDGSRDHAISGGRHDEGPSWAPSGRAIAFERTPREGSPPEVWITDLSGKVQRKVALPWGGGDVSWSGRLP